MKATKPWNNRRFIGTFDVENTTKGDSGRYRCIVHSDKGVGVSNYGELTIKREYWSQRRAKHKHHLSEWTQHRQQECFPSARPLCIQQSQQEINRKCCVFVDENVLLGDTKNTSFLCWFVIRWTLILSCVKAVLDCAQFHLKDHKGKRHQGLQ